MNLRTAFIAVTLTAALTLPVAASVLPATAASPYSGFAFQGGELSMDSVTRAYQVSADVDAKSKADPAFRDKMDKMGPDNPDFAPIASQYGFSPADYFNVTSSYLKATMAYGKIKAGDDSAAAIAGMGTSQADVDFVKDNYDALKALDGKYPNPMMTTP